VDTDESEPTTKQGGVLRRGPRPDQLQCFGGEPGLGVVWFGLTTRTRSVGLVNTSRSDLRVRNRSRRAAGVVGLMFATVEPSGHVVAGDLPQSAVVDGDLGQERSDAGQPGEGGAPRTSPPPRGAPHAARRSRPAVPGRPATPARAPVEATKAVGGERRSHAAVVRSGAGCCMVGRRQRDCAGCGAPVGYLGPEYCCLCYAPGIPRGRSRRRPAR
jgi:hypothetical protein